MFEIHYCCKTQSHRAVGLMDRNIDGLLLKMMGKEINNQAYPDKWYKGETKNLRSSQPGTEWERIVEQYAWDSNIPQGKAGRKHLTQ
jgi:hypothetical protein